MSPEKAEIANQEVRGTGHLLALGMIQPSLSPCASGIVLVKEKNGELRSNVEIKALRNIIEKAKSIQKTSCA